LVARHPYLGTAFEFTAREPGTAPFLSRLHNFTFGAMPSLGLTGAAIPGLRYGIPRLVNGVMRDLFREDASTYYQELIAYAEPELHTVESEVGWIDGLAAAAISGARRLLDEFDKPLHAKTLQEENASQDVNDKSASILLEPARMGRAAAHSRPKRRGSKSPKQSGRPK